MKKKELKKALRVERVRNESLDGLPERPGNEENSIK